MTPSFSDLAWGAGGGAAAFVSAALSREVQRVSEHSLGIYMDSLISLRVQGSIARLSRDVFAMPVRFLQNRLNGIRVENRPFPQFISSNVIIPLLEEGIYRFGIQGGTHYALTRCGMNNEAAWGASIFCASTLFAMAHNAGMNTAEFSSMMVTGLIFGGLGAYSILAASVAHMVHNIAVDVFSSFYP